MRRIHIVGGAGSGKTSLARRLSARLHAPAYDLDAVAFEGGAGPRRPLAVCLQDVAQIAAGATWITEGVYLWWTDVLVGAADTIIWLDLPYRIAAWRILLRHVRASLAGTNKFPGIWRLTTFLWWTRGYYLKPSSGRPASLDDLGAISRAATARYLVPYRDKLVHCRRPADVAAFLLTPALTPPDPSIDS